MKSELMNNGSGMKKTNSGWADKSKKCLPLLVLVLVAAIVVQQGWYKYLTLEHIAANRDILRAYVSDNFLFAILGYAAIYVCVVALSLPGGALLTITGGFLLGWLLAGVVTVIAATIGATIIFAVAKTSFGETLQAKAGRWLDKLSRGFREDALSYLLFLRLVPAFPFWLVNLAPALLGVKLSTFIFGTFIGIIPGTFAFSFLGAGLDSIIDAQQKAFQTCLKAQGSAPAGDACNLSLDPGSLLTKELIIAFVVLGFVALIPVVLKRVKRKSA
jgi:uncharacterized membrane protein YdjX (TVP38/TMEM64 family)